MNKLPSEINWLELNYQLCFRLYAAGQNAFLHLNVHLIPRFTGDCKDPRGGVRWVIPDRANYWSQR